MREYYFRKWKRVLEELEKHVLVDLEYQTIKAHDRTCCEAAQRLGGILVKYMALYNDSLDCLHQNLQMQKTSYIEDVVKAITARILELKRHLRKLESQNYQFLGNGLIQHMLTFDNADLKDIPSKVKRSEHMQAMIDEVLLRAAEEKEAALHKGIKEENTPPPENIVENWWEVDEEDNDKIKEANTSKVNEKLSEESIKRIEMIKLIQAHERSRQVIRSMTKRKLQREMWEKELRGTLKPQAKFEVKERAARLIQNIFRAYFKIKRNQIIQCKVDEALHINLCKKFVLVEKVKNDKIKEQRLNKQKYYEKAWESDYEELKTIYLKKEEDKISDDYRELIRYWFWKWFEEVKFFYDIPKEEHGGSALIFKDEVPTPSEWKLQYEAYLEEKKANKNKTALQKKWEKTEAKREEIEIKKEEFRKRKQEEALLQKMMKNPKAHPGFYYPDSKTTEYILKVIKNYKKDWQDLDYWETEGVKEGSVKDVDKNNAYMDVKMELLKTVDEEMREELKILKKALKNDYKRSEEKMPETIKLKLKRPKRKRKLKSTITESVQNKIEDLAVAGFLKDRTQITFQDFLGDFNFAGDDLRCMMQTALPFGGELRSLWWERCNELYRGARRILLIGPQGSGKTTLVHILASVNDAMLFELDPSKISQDVLSAAYLRQTVSSVVTCAKAVQPSVIHIKALHQIYCKKAPPNENKINLELYKRFFVQNLMKKIRKTDMITIIGSCYDPWLTKSGQLLKKFPEVIMLPESTYSTVSMILKNWMTDNRIVPRNLNLQSVAQVLQGYSFGYLKDALNSFLTPENILKIAAYGLSPRELVDHVTRDGSEESIDYKKYRQWYTDYTAWGKKEAKRLKDDKEFELVVEKFAKKKKKLKNEHEMK
ncbi:unnamed protein product [Parnassius mnemosyne]|uniref:ATPase AAA-type core domain-containing protein n=1 Tax=Parnassius mnemosyne TaxID=213953 RepID=A0AAV1LYG6_9NEOP